MVKWTWAALLLAGAALGQTSSTVAVLAGFDATPAPGVLEAMQTELRSLFTPAGLSLEWYALEAPAFLGRPDAVVAVRFTGACRWDWVSPPLPVAGVLAWTARIDGQLQPLVTVDCARISAFVDAPSEALLGRALARVVAHELYHYLTRQVTHTHSALNRLSVRPRDLLAPAAHFDAAELAALKKGSA